MMMMMMMMMMRLAAAMLAKHRDGEIKIDDNCFLSELNEAILFLTCKNSCDVHF